MDGIVVRVTRHSQSMRLWRVSWHRRPKHFPLRNLNYDQASRVPKSTLMSIGQILTHSGVVFARPRTLICGGDGITSEV